ncbi:MAG: hypothetical protein JST00_43695 [Deltaproteobacteria bacterium]|nr:hypothetical protein [Deltaproteobacteria bacterium]
MRSHASRLRRIRLQRLLGATAVVVAIAIAPASAQADEATPAPSSSAPSSSPASPGEPPASTTTEPPKAESKRTAWPWIVLGTGLALVATSAVFAGLTVHEDDKREEAEQKLFGLTPNDAQYKTLQTEVENRKDRSSSNRTTSIVFGTVGFLTIAGSILWWYFEGAASEPKAATKPRLTPALGPGYAGAAMGFAF